ncbi:ankyrin repeat-containing domain protein [Nemania abortiva]|nr:ankyrin repeat-containing domain protein [Nemania abortiva]
MAAATTSYAQSDRDWFSSYNGSSSISSAHDSLPDLLEPSVKSKTPEFGNADLQKLLQRRLEQAGAFPRNWTARSPSFQNSNDGPDDAVMPSHLPYPCLFKHLGKSIAQAGFLGQWITSTSKRCFWIQVPSGLDNPFFFASVVTSLAASQPQFHVTTAIIGHHSMATKQLSAEYLLTSLCFQLLSDSDAAPNLGCSELLNDFKNALSSLNGRWRESMLWVLLKYLLTSGTNKRLVIALGFPFESGAHQTFNPTIERILELAKITDRNIKVLLLSGRGHGSNFGRPHGMAVDMGDNDTAESLRADISSWLAAVVDSRPSLKILEEELLFDLLRYLPHPLLAFSALQTLHQRTWISKHRLAIEPTRLYNVSSVLERVPVSERPLVVNIMRILGYCCRPLTTTELAAAFSTSTSPSSLTQPSQNSTIDLEFDIQRTLPGLVYIQDGLVWSLLPYLVSDSVRGRLSTEKLPDWLDMGPNAEMQLAHICLGYISRWSRSGKNLIDGNEINLAGEWPFLNYAVTFWSHHYSRASRHGVRGIVIERLLVNDEPHLIQTWLELQDAFNPSRMSMTNKVKAADISQLSLAAIFNRYELQLVDSISVIDLASKILPYTDSDLSISILLSLWHCRDHNIGMPGPAWMERVGLHFSFDSLTEMIAYLPETVFDILLAGHAEQNRLLCLSTAVRQGDGMLAGECIRHMQLDAQLLSDLLSTSSCLEGGIVSVLRGIAHTERSFLDGEEVSQIMKRLLHRAARYSHFQLINLLLGYNLGLTQSEVTDILKISLHRASAHNFLAIAQALLESGVSPLETTANGDTPAHVAARAGHFDIVRLLNQYRIEPDEEFGAREITNALDVVNKAGQIPIEVAVTCEHEATVALLLRITPRRTLLSRHYLLHNAILHGQLELVEFLLNIPDLDVDWVDRNRHETALIIACEMGSTSIVRKLLERGAKSWPTMLTYSPWARLCLAKDESARSEIANLLVSEPYGPGDEMRMMALHNTARLGKEDLMVALLNAGADKNARWFGSTPMHQASEKGHENAVRVLLMRGVDQTVLDDRNRTPLFLAAQGGHLGVLRLLMEGGGRCSLEDLTMLTGKGKLEVLKVILKYQEELRGSKILAECLRIALRTYNHAIVNLLLDYDADTDSESARGCHGNAIHECAYYGNIKMARLLLDYHDGVTGETVNSGHQGSLQSQRLAEQQEMIKYLIEKSGDVHNEGGKFGTILNAAASGGEPDLVTCILDEADFDIQDVDEEGRSAAHLACSSLNRQDSTDMLELISERAGGPEIFWRPDKHGRLPLHFACGGGRRQVVQYLLSAEIRNGDDCMHRCDNDGWTPLHWACRHWDTVPALIQSLVLEYGSRIDSKTKKGWTAWDVAVFHDNEGVTAVKPKDVKSCVEQGMAWDDECDSCQCVVYGERYICRQCPAYNLCFKCYDRADLHAGGSHKFRSFETDHELHALEYAIKGLGDKAAGRYMGVMVDEPLGAVSDDDDDDDDDDDEFAGLDSLFDGSLCLST